MSQKKGGHQGPDYKGGVLYISQEQWQKKYSTHYLFHCSWLIHRPIT
jgi:hypothetical protein